MSSALLKFKFEYNLRFAESKIPVNRTIDNNTWLAVGRMLGPDRLNEELNTLKDETVKKLLQGLPIIVVPPYSESMAACDKKIAKLMGDKQAIVGRFMNPKRF